MPLRTLTYGNDGIFLIMGIAASVPSTVVLFQGLGFRVWEAIPLYSGYHCSMLQKP